MPSYTGSRPEPTGEAAAHAHTFPMAAATCAGRWRNESISPACVPDVPHPPCNPQKLTAMTVHSLAALGDFAGPKADDESAPTPAGSPLRAIASWASWVAAALATAGLLLSLGWVVQDHVRQAQARHQANEAHANAMGRCAVLAQRDLREDCRRLARLEPTQAKR